MAQAQAPTDEIKPLKCRSCDRQVAETNGTDLFIKGQKVPGDPIKVTFPCPFCGEIIKFCITQN